jgi:phosphomannomutase
MTQGIEAGVFGEIFKRYDIRGLFPEQLNGEIAYRLGMAFASFMGCKTVAVGRDCRIGSEQLFKGFSKGLVEQGCRVIDLGLISTDMIYFAVGKYRLDAGCMITASHNPKEWNGFKFVGKGASGISVDNGLEEIRVLAEKGEFKAPKKKGFVEKKGIMGEYIKKIISFVDAGKIKPLRIVIDASNGMAAKTISSLEKDLPVKITKLFFAIDGNFPNHEPNPLRTEALETLQKKVVSEKADLGAIFDGDGDRMLMVDETGLIVNGSELTCLIASTFLKKHPGEKILYTPVMSKAVKETIVASGGIPVVERVGHTFIKVRMRKEKALFGGELSGHFYFRGNYFADSAIIALLVALEAVSVSGKTLSAIVKPYRKYSSIPETNFDVKDKAAKIAEIERAYGQKALSTSKLDGFSANFADWWFNVRPSGTEPKLRLNLEADSPELRDRKKEELLKMIAT